MPQNPFVKMEEDKIFMRRCIQLALNAIDTAAPNPMVGAVVVHEGKIIGEGWHRKAGEPHAEPNAIHSVKNQELLKESTLYVSLEPCSHYGKTPPCADLIIEKQIPRVVIGCEDPFSEVSGRGIRKLQDAGIEVIVGVEKEACLQLNRSFITFHQKKRPYITLKWAQSLDGKIDTIRNSPQTPALQISDDFSSLLVHKLRHESDAIMVGSGTALLDNPSLSVRNWPSSRKPIRIVLDSQGKLPSDATLLDGSAKTLIFTQKEQNSAKDNCQWIQAKNLEEIMQELHRRGIQRLLVEGGSRLHQSLIDSDLWDEIRIETAPWEIGTGVQAPQLKISPENSHHFVYRETITCSGHKIQHIFKP